MTDELGSHFRIQWIDHHRDPQEPPNPNFPNGRPLDISQGRSPNCTVELVHPTKRCGIYVIHCTKCRQRVAATTAGRVDDPSSVKMYCKVENLN